MYNYDRKRSSNPPPTANQAEPLDENIGLDDDCKMHRINAAAAGHLQSQSSNDMKNYYHLKITNVQLYDENEYACETSKRNEYLHSLVYLHVSRKCPRLFYF